MKVQMVEESIEAIDTVMSADDGRCWWFALSLAGFQPILIDCMLRYSVDMF